MKLMYACVAVLGACLSGCTGVDDGAAVADEGHVASALARPPLNLICSSICNNSHNVRSCLDQRTSGTVNVSVFPLLAEIDPHAAIPLVPIGGPPTTFLPSTILGTTTGWSSTSCPHCQWHLVSITNDRNGGVVTSGVTQSPSDVNLQRAVNGQTDMSFHVNIEISDPTDASVGVCDLSVGIELVTGIIQ